MIRKKRVALLIFLVIAGVWAGNKGIWFFIQKGKPSGPLILVDAGHGGKDPGTISASGVYEKNINLAIAKKVQKKLQGKGYATLCTREEDLSIENSLRAKIANDKRARVFVSLHGNAAKGKQKIQGVQVLYRPYQKAKSGHAGSLALAQRVSESIAQGTGCANRGIIQRKDLIVLNQAKMPAILIEYGFLSDKQEEALLRTPSYQNRLADSIVAGLDQYFKDEQKK